MTYCYTYVIIYTTMNKTLIGVILITALLNIYAVKTAYKQGRSSVTRDIAKAFNEASADTFFFKNGDIVVHPLTDDLDEIEKAGILEVGRCFSPEGESLLIKHLDEYVQAEDGSIVHNSYYEQN